VALAAVLITTGGGLAARADETSIGGSVDRGNWDAAEPGLTSDAVSQSDFGPIFDRTLPRPAGQDATTFPNQVYAQPLVAAGRLIVATEENQVDALDPLTGELLWSRSLGPAWAPTPTCGDLVPHVGVTSTPVYDPATHALYLVAKVATTDPAHPDLKMFALNVADGSDRAGWPVPLGGAAANSGQVLNMATAHQRAGLLLLDGSVYFATASHCDRGPYVGFVGGVTTTGTPRLSLWSSEVDGVSSGAGIWQAGGGLMSDGPGRIFLATGNGVSPAPGPGTTPPGTLAESVVRLAVGANGTLSTADYFSPADNADLDQDDADLGSGAPVALPGSFGTPAHPHLLVIVGKDGTVRLLDRDDLGGTAQGAGGSDRVVSSMQLSGVWGRAAVFASGANHLLYLLPSRAPLQVLRVAPDAEGVPTLSVAASSPASYGYTSGSPVVTSDGDNASTALVWIVTCAGSAGTDARLTAFPAVPPAGGSWRPVASYDIGTVAKFVQPATDGGRIYVGTRDGRVLAFGRPTRALLAGSATDFGTSPVGTPVTRDIVLTAQDDLHVTDVSVGAPFQVDSTEPVLPVTLDEGDPLTLSVTFTPTTARTSDDELVVTTTDDDQLPTTYRFTVSGTGTQEGIDAAPSAVDFGDVRVGEAGQLGVTLRNTGLEDATVTGVDPPSGPFTASLPPVGYVLPAQQTVTVTVRYTPTASGTDAGSFTLSTSNGPITVGISGSAETGSPHLSVPSSLALGNLPPGTTARIGLPVTNSGTTTLTITKAAPPAAPFTVGTPLSEGQRIAPGDSITVFIDVRPTSARPATDTYVITGDDGAGARPVRITVNDQPWVGPVVAPLGCLDVLSNRRANGTPAVSFPCNGSHAQQFARGPAGSLRFGGPTSPWCLDVPHSATAAGTALQLYTCNRTAAQTWLWDAAGRLVNPHSRRCIDVRGHSAAYNVPLVLADCGSARSQRWDASAIWTTRGYVGSAVAAAGQLCVTDRGGSTVAGTPVRIDVCGADGQVVTRNGSTLQIAGQCVAVAGAYSRPGRAVLLEPCSGADTQRWRFGARGQLTNVATNLCLDDPKRTTAPGTALQVFACNGTIAQSWTQPW